MTKSAIEKAIAYRKERLAKKRFPYEKIYWLLSLYEGKEVEDRELSCKDYEYIKSIQVQQEDKLRALSPDQLSVCNRIYERYQTKDVR